MGNWKKLATEEFLHSTMGDSEPADAARTLPYAFISEQLEGNLASCLPRMGQIEFIALRIYLLS